jgi:PAS domain S-box-containing protein
VDTSEASQRFRLPAGYLRRVVELSSEGVVCADPGCRIVYLNAAAERMFGYAHDELLGEDLKRLLPEALQGSDDPEDGEWIRDGRRLEGRRKDGSAFPAEASVARARAGDEALLTVVVRDVAEQVRLLAEARAARDEARTAASRARFLLGAGEALGRTLDSDETVAALALAPVPELADWTIVYLLERGREPRRVEVYHPSEERRGMLARIFRELPPGAAVADPIRHAVEVGEAVRLVDTLDLSWETLAATGRGRDLRALLEGHVGALVPLPLRGAAIGVLGLFRGRPRGRFSTDEMALARDLAHHAALSIENARLHRQAREAVRLRDEVLGVVSHDLRNPIAIISMTMQLLREVDLPPEDRDRRMQAVERAAGTMNRLVTDLLDMSSIDAGRLSLDRDAVPATTLVEKAYLSFQPLAEQKGIALERSEEPGLPRVVADMERVMQVFSNLIGNALKFSDAGATVRMEAERRDGDVCFRVIDNGPGISPEDAAHVFDRFWQVRQTGRGGAGLGLAIARGIVEGHGGEMGVESTVGEGSTFWFTLPVDRRDGE